MSPPISSVTTPEAPSTNLHLGPALPPSLGRDLRYFNDRPVTRAVTRFGLALARRVVLSVEGVEHISGDRDPFVVAANHSQRLEAVLVPTVLVALRNGRQIHFMADWPMLMVPGVGLIYRCGEVIPVFGKSARPAFLNRLKPIYRRRFRGLVAVDDESPGNESPGHESPGTEQNAWQVAAGLLRRGKSVGVFPEGTMNRDPNRLLRGRTTVARLAIENGVSVVPVGIRFPAAQDRPIRDVDAMTIHIGESLSPPSPGADRSRIQAFHAEIMGRISQLSGKSWNPESPRRTSRS